jgi:hypothetical protein
MNFRKHNQDLKILQIEGRRARFGKTPGWAGVDWKPTPLGGNIVFLRQVTLPPTCSVPRTDFKIEAPPNLYEPAANGLLMFYRNLWISPGIRLWHARTRRWEPMPRLFGGDGDGFGYLCVHPDPVTPEKNILDFIRVVDLFLLNPGYKKSATERM